MIIAFSGYAGSGKDTAARITEWLIYQNQRVVKNKLSLQEWMDMNVSLENWKVKKFATAVREVGAVLLNKPASFLSREEFKQEYLEDYQMTGRQFLQKIDTDALRDGLHPDVWIKALMNQYQPLNTNIKKRWMGHAITMGNDSLVYPNWLITDLRFPNEYDALRDVQAVTIRIRRGSLNPIVDAHVSEIALDSYEFDTTIYNTGTFEDLAEKLDRFYKSIDLYGRI